MDLIFLGMNEAGEKVYEWLNDREDVEVKALLTEKEQLSLIEDLEPEIVIASGFEHKVPGDFVEIPEKGIVNLHPSFLPYNRGSHPYIWPIIEDTPAGVSLHYMNSEIDEGPVIARREVRIEPDDTAKDLYQRLSFEMFQIFKENWEGIKQGSEDGKDQNLSRGTYHKTDDLEKTRELDLDQEMRLGEAIDLLRGLTFPSKQLGYFERNGEKYFLRLNIERED